MGKKYKEHDLPLWFQYPFECFCTHTHEPEFLSSLAPSIQLACLFPSASNIQTQRSRRSHSRWTCLKIFLEFRCSYKINIHQNILYFSCNILSCSALLERAYEKSSLLLHLAGWRLMSNAYKKYVIRYFHLSDANSHYQEMTFVSDIADYKLKGTILFHIIICRTIFLISIALRVYTIHQLVSNVMRQNIFVLLLKLVSIASF